MYVSYIVITILCDIVEWRRIRSLNEMAKSSGDTLSDPLHWFWWLLLMHALPSPCPFNPLQLLLCTLLKILLPHAFNPLFALLRISSSHKCCVREREFNVNVFWNRPPPPQPRSNSGLRCVKKICVFGSDGCFAVYVSTRAYLCVYSCIRVCMCDRERDVV